MKIDLAKSAVVGALLGLGALQGAGACIVELGWSATQGDVRAVLVADFASDTAVTKQTYDPNLLASDVGKLGLSLRDAKTDAELAQADLMDLLQQQQQLLAMLSEVSKQLSDMALSIIRNILGVAPLAAAGDGGEYLLAISSSAPGFETIYLSLDCAVACDGVYAADWAFDKYIPEPGSGVLAASALALLSLLSPKWRRPARPA